MSVVIQCNDLILGHGRNPLTQPINLQITQNQWLGIVGENGAGKSTLLKCILGLISPASGTITVFNAPVRRYNKYISYIPQERELNLNDHLSGYSLIKASFQPNRLGLPAFSSQLNQRVEMLLDTVGAAHYAKSAFQSLSGGQKKRIFLAQALVNQPKLLLLDEPLSDLDPKAKHDFIRALKRIHKQHNLTLLIISHDMHEIAHELDNFIHFKHQKVHLCQELPCLIEDKNVIL